MVTLGEPAEARAWGGHLPSTLLHALLLKINCQQPNSQTSHVLVSACLYTAGSVHVDSRACVHMHVNVPGGQRSISGAPVKLSIPKGFSVVFETVSHWHLELGWVASKMRSTYAWLLLWVLEM